MGLAYPVQRFQDWFTQQWVIVFGKKLDPTTISWLIGPFGNLSGIGVDFINQLAERENLNVERDIKNRGLILSIKELNLSNNEVSNLSQKVINFYENTADYSLDFTVKWNPFFKIFGVLINRLFSNRIEQLNIPIENIKDSKALKSEIINLTDPKSNEIKYTIWLRMLESNRQVIYSGVYCTCTLPSGKTCIKAIFPLPKGNATVIMTPSVGVNGELILNSSGEKFGDSGFYFLLNDTKGNLWSKYIKPFRDQLTVSSINEHIFAEQILTLWNQRVLRFNYKIFSSADGQQNEINQHYP